MRPALLACAVVLALANPAHAQVPSPAGALHAAVAAACGNCIVGVSIGDPTNPASWSLDFAPGATSAQQAQAAAALAGFNLAAWQAVSSALSAGTIQIACAPSASVCTSAIAGTYRADAAAQQQIASIVLAINTPGVGLPGGGGTFNYPDAGGTMHAFTGPQFVEFGAALLNFVYGLSQGTAPSQPLALP